MKFTCFSFLFLPLLAAVSPSCDSWDNPPPARDPLCFEEVMSRGLEGCMGYYDIPGCSWAVLRADSLAHSGSEGRIHSGSDIRIDPTGHFQIGSLGKSYTAFLAARCVEEGLLTWETRLFDVLPGWREEANRAYDSLRLMDLLSHNTPLPPLNVMVTHLNRKTGKPVYENLPAFEGTDLERRHAFCRYALSLEPVETSGLNYGNAGYSLAAAMLEQVTGRSWEELAGELAGDLGIEIGQERPNKTDPTQPWGHRRRDDGTLEPVGPADARFFTDPISSPRGTST
ncbi:MAG: serine hydrolase domain-containing protein [Bacteroidales bacterium]